MSQLLRSSCSISSLGKERPRSTSRLGSCGGPYGPVLLIISSCPTACCSLVSQMRKIHPSSFSGTMLIRTSSGALLLRDTRNRRSPTSSLSKRTGTNCTLLRVAAESD